jgi:hypothetical protein
MMRLFLAVTSLALLGACASQLASTPPAGTPAEIAAPEVRPGSVWRYAVSDGFTKLPRGSVEYRVRAIEGNTVTVDVITNGRESTELYSREGNWLRRPATNMQTFTYSPAYRAFDFPLVAGKSWSAQATATDPADGRSFPVSIRGRVLGWERIRVPAGEFDTLKVRRRVFLDYFQLGDRGQSVIEETDWYAPALGHVVRSETTSQYLKLAGTQRAPGLMRVSDDHSNDAILPRYEQDEWLVYQLTGYSDK